MWEINLLRQSPERYNRNRVNYKIVIRNINFIL